MLSFFPRYDLDEIWDLTESFYEGFPTYSCLVVNPIKVNSIAYLFNCTTVDRASD